MTFPELPIKGNIEPGMFKVYCPDTGLLLSALDDETVTDFKANRNIGTYNGGLAENIVAEAFLKAGKQLCYFKKDDSTLEMDFFLRTASCLVPVEVKASNDRAKSLSTLVGSAHYPDISFGIKLIGGNVGKAGGIYTFPHFCAFLLPRFLKSQD